jgi:DNA-binding CsgD family transcriptional regulator
MCIADARAPSTVVGPVEGYTRTRRPEPGGIRLGRPVDRFTQIRYQIVKIIDEFIEMALKLNVIVISCIAGLMNDVVLTEREREVMRLLAFSKTPRQISEQIGVSLRTVEHDIIRLRARLNARDVAALRLIARNQIDHC